MRDLVQKITIERPPEAVWDLISDPDRYPDFFKGLTRWKLLTEEPGTGARYRVLMQVGSIEAGGIVSVTAWRQPEVIRWESEQGIHQRGSWKLSPAGSGTEVILEIGFDLSGGPVGRLVETIAGRIVARNMWATLLAARRLLRSADDTQALNRATNHKGDHLGGV